ncbi:MAG TPA: translation initiation factor IF-2, partial [Candidatus Wunengus sp. YC61]|uniref:translation initiation factor IF-2 n=1 Tax=Candidatus Wunengus sp. YC61 TaxID=3367698 RepID=UPI004029137E
SKKDLKRLAEIEEDEDQATAKPGKKVINREAEDSIKLKPSRRKVIYKKKEDHTTKDLYEKEDVLEPSRGPAVKKVPPKRIKKKTEVTIPKAIKRKIKILETITVNELAKKMGIKVGNVIKKLLDLGVVATINQPLDIDTASLIASEFSYAVESIPIEEDILEKEEDAPEELVHRPPVVTVMGHVDHGKTSLLDAIRETNVIGKEAGGITQHIGAYHVSLPKGDIVFLDTPGHEAFTAMRARGAQVTDIVVLVVAADDGVMSQTVEAINHAKAAGVTLMVAINKIDKPNADTEKVKRSLMEYGLVSEELGGDTVFVEVSAKKKQGINDILELILLQAELLELKANPNKAAKGVVIEAKLDKGRGPVATVLIKEGTLKVGDPFVVGVQFGKIRALINENGEKVTQVGPAMPIEIIGLSGVPEAGDSFIVVDDEKKTRQIALLRQQKKRESELVKTSKIALENLYDKIQEGYVKELNIIVKADVQGSIEALLKALNELSTDAVKLHVIHASVGDIGESDVMLASASNAITIGFNVKSDTKVQQIAEQEKVSIRIYSIIYNAISDMKKAMEGLLDPILEEKTLGRAEVRSIFDISRTGTIAGSFVLNGKIVKGEHARLLRDNVVIHDGKIYSLKRFKDDVKEVESGYECGIGIENFNDLKVDDIVESYTYEKVLATL